TFARTEAIRAWISARTSATCAFFAGRRASVSTRHLLVVLGRRREHLRELPQQAGELIGLLDGLGGELTDFLVGHQACASVADCAFGQAADRVRVRQR